MLNVIILNVIMLRAVMLGDVILSVLASVADSNIVFIDGNAVMPPSLDIQLKFFSMTLWPTELPDKRAKKLPNLLGAREAFSRQTDGRS